jgi:hypothetical protein
MPAMVSKIAAKMREALVNDSPQLSLVEGKLQHKNANNN